MSLLFGKEEEKLRNDFYELIRKIKNSENNYDKLMLDCLKIIKQYRTIPLESINKKASEMYRNFVTASKNYSTKFSIIYNKYYSTLKKEGVELEKNELEKELEEVIKTLASESKISGVEINIRGCEDHERLKGLQKIMRDLTEILDD